MRFSLFTIFKLIAFLSLTLVTACGSGNSSNSHDAFTRSTIARDNNPQVAASDLTAVVAGNTDFALKVFRTLDADPDNNAVFSPYSVTQAFLLLAPGARGETLRQIEQTLSFPLSQALLNPAFDKLDLLLDSKTTDAVANDQHVPTLLNANAVWVQAGFPIAPAYLDTIAAEYGAGLHLLDFAGNSGSSRRVINDWIAAKTNDRIANMIPEAAISSQTRLVLTNALWFKADWAIKFDEANTEVGTFYNRNGSTSTVQLMRQEVSLRYAQLNGCDAVELPYVGGNLSMLVVMPAAGTFDSFLADVTPTSLAEVTSGLRDTHLQLSLPKFSFSKAASMKEILKSLGMTDPFDATRADFSGIDGRHDLSVSDVFHKSFISVAEEGTEAAAATAILTTGVSNTVWQQPPQRLVVDHPFIFVIRDRETGLILFMGKVVSLN